MSKTNMHYRITSTGKIKNYVKYGWICGLEKVHQYDILTIKDRSTTNPLLVNCKNCKQNTMFKAILARKLHE